MVEDWVCIQRSLDRILLGKEKFSSLLNMVLFYHNVIHLNKEHDQLRYTIFRKLDIEGT